jgi:hypothetical protein
MAQVRNVSRRLVSFSGNSGQTWHIPPSTAIELEEFELQNNAKLKKLEGRRLIEVVRSGKQDEPAGGERERNKKSRAFGALPGRAQQGD